MKSDPVLKYKKQVRELAGNIANSIRQLPLPVSDQHVLEVMRNQKCTPQLLCDAFWQLDNGTLRFGDYDLWHPRLRSLRNNPVVGEKMFALFG